MKLTDLTLLALQTAFMQKDPTTQAICGALDGELRDTALKAYGLLMYQALAPSKGSPFYDEEKDKGFAFKLNDTPFGNELLDELAWQFHTDFYDKSISFHRRKELVRQSIKFHRTKGTPQAVIDILKTSFPSDTQLLEWFQYGGEPYHFKIITSSTQSVDMTMFMRALGTVKNARSRLEAITFYESIICNAVNIFKNNRSIEYTAVPVGIFDTYAFGNDEVIAFGIAEKSYNFIVKEV